MQRSDWFKKDAWLESSTRAREGMRGDWVKTGEASGKRRRRCRKERERKKERRPMRRGVVYMAWLKRRTRSEWGVGKAERILVFSIYINWTPPFILDDC